MASTSTGNSTDGEVPIAKHDEFGGLLNTLEELILNDGYDALLQRSDELCETLESLNEILEINFAAFQKATEGWNERLLEKPRAFQQLIYLLKLIGVEKNLWKRLLPCLVFARLTKKALRGAERWVPPRRRKKRKHTEKTKKLAGISYMVSIKKMLREAIDKKDTEAVAQIMKELQDNLPFGSAANLFEGVQEFHRQHERELELQKKQKKVRHCYFVKIGRGKMPKLANEHFCTVNRRFILPYRNPDNVKKSTMEDELDREMEESTESSESEDEYYFTV